METSSRRQPVPHISLVRENYEDSRDVLLGLLDAEPNAISEAASLVAMAGDIKKAFRACRDHSRRLAARLSALGASNESRELKEHRLELHGECTSFINSINGQLSNLDLETVSNVDAGSIYSGLDGSQIKHGVLKLPTLETGNPIANDVPEKSEKAGGDLLPTSTLPLTPKEKVDNFLRDFGSVALGADRDENGARPKSFLSSRGRLGTHTLSGVAGAGSGLHRFSSPPRSVSTSASFHLHPPPFKTATTYSNYLNPLTATYTQSFKPTTHRHHYNPPITTYTQHHKTPLTTTHQRAVPSSSYPQLYEPNDTNSAHNRHFQAIDPASQHLIKQDLFRGSFDKFSGEPHKYNAWFRVLKNRMKNLSLDAMDVITILSASTEGEPHRMIQNLLAAVGDDPQATLDLMLYSLYNRFGSDIRISSSLKKQLAVFPLVKPPNIKDKLRDLTDLCRIVLVNQTNNRELMVFNSSDDQRVVWQKLPEWLQAKWRSRGHEYMMRNCESPPFYMLVEFLEKHSDEMSNPNFEGLESGALNEISNGSQDRKSDVRSVQQVCIS